MAQKNNILRLAAFLVLFLGFIPLLAQEESKSAILGYQLGAHKDSLQMKGLLKRGKYQKLMRYDREEEAVDLDGVQLTYMHLFFWEDRLHSIEIKASGKEGDKLLIWLQAQYGEGKKEDALGFRYLWSETQFRVLWDQNLVTHDGVATFVSEKVNNRYYKYMYELKNGG